MSDVIDGWLNSANKVPSPNFEEIPEREISLLVIHCISLPPGEFGGPYIDQFFTNKLKPSDHPFFEGIYDMRVTSHLLITREGEIKQYVPFEKCAHHAGQSEFQGRANCNEYSIGIELEGTVDEPFTEAQYEKLISVTQSILNNYPQITAERIVGHSDIAPGRKKDPGQFFDWERYKLGINESLSI